jgi:hypothetical protein
METMSSLAARALMCWRVRRATIYWKATPVSDRLYGGAGVNVLRGGAGSDLLVSNAAADQLIGGTGHDIYHLASGLATVSEDANARR